MRRGAPFLLALLAVGGLAFANGGHDPTAWGWAAIGLAWAAAAALVLRDVRQATRLELLALGALAALACWAALSAWWSLSVPLSLLDAQRLLVPVAALAAFVALRGGRAALAGVAAAATLASAWNLVTRVGAGPDTGADAQPLGYGNGVAILAGVGLLLALGLAREQRWWLLACFPLASALLLADSRGALLAVAAGAAATAALRSPRAGVAFPAVLAAGALGLGIAAVAGSDERSAYWRVAVSEAAERPLLGSGAGTWVRSWLAERDEVFPARDAHGLYIETLSELGPAGLALVLAALLAPLAAALRARGRPLVPAAAGAYAAFVLHAGVDWDLELTAVAVAGVACGAFLLAEGGGRTLRLPRVPALTALAAVGLLGALGLAGNSFV
ncbi:MAG TPA: O-antigen ligase family protein, partial [Gaiellaceae bacterium]|nr:O-antigen ligase family protein [Gaiellaceae bacterium]